MQSVFDIGVPWMGKRGYRTRRFPGRGVGPDGNIDRWACVITMLFLLYRWERIVYGSVASDGVVGMTVRNN